MAIEPYLESRMDIEGMTLIARWHGGPYIDLYRNSISSGAKEVINVWDYREGKATIPFEQSALRRKLQWWVNIYCDGNGEEALAHDMRENW